MKMKAAPKTIAETITSKKTSGYRPRIPAQDSERRRDGGHREQQDLTQTACIHCVPAQSPQETGGSSQHPQKKRTGFSSPQASGSEQVTVATEKVQ